MDVILPVLFVWLLNAVIAVGVFVSLFTFGEPVTKPATSASVTYWRHRNQADVYLRRVCAQSLLTYSFSASTIIRGLMMEGRMSLRPGQWLGSVI